MSKQRFPPAHVHQDDGSPCQWSNCWAAVGAWLVRGATLGKKRPSPSAFRARAGVRTCRAGGLGDIMRGLAGYGVRFTYLVDTPKAKVRKRFSAKVRKLYAVETDFDAWPADKKCDRGQDFSDYHMVGVVPGLNKRRAVRTMDPNTCRKLKWVPVSDVIAAALEYNREHHEKPGTIDLLVVNVSEKP